MKQLVDHNPAIGQSSDLPTMVTVICRLMTLYFMRPCEPLAVNTNRHMNALLSSPAADILGGWRSTFQQLHIQWKAIAKRHAQQLP